MHPFSTHWKHKTLRFSNVVRGVEKGCIGNRWVKEAWSSHGNIIEIAIMLIKTIYRNPVKSQKNYAKKIDMLLSSAFSNI